MLLGLAITLSLSGIFLISLKAEFQDQHTININRPLFPIHSSSSYTFQKPKIPDVRPKKRRTPHDKIKPKMIFMGDTSKIREGYKIHEDETLEEGHIHRNWYDGDDYLDPYYAFDDDQIKFPGCRRVSWHRYIFPNCNTFHEISMYETEGVSHGHYRNVLKLNHTYSGEVVLKVLRVERGYNTENYEYVKNDALVMERLTSSPRIVDMYGHCGSSILQETLEHDIESLVVPEPGWLKNNRTLNDEHDVDPQNKFTPLQKLSIALSIAEPIADLHGFKDGVIVHDDIQLAQFLYDKQNKLKLNDFNRAEIMLWDEQNQEYCRYHNGKVFGNYRSPEEVDDRPLNEKIDVFSYGNMVYNLLTGLWNYYDITDDQVVQDKLSIGEFAFVDERYKNHSFEEGALVHVIQRCWVKDVDRRADIFEVIGYLRKALEKARKMRGVE